MNTLMTEMKKRLKEFEIEKVTAENYRQLTEVYETNEDFFILTEGEKATVENCLKDIESIPPGFDMKDKSFVMLKQNGRAIALMDILTGFPSPGIVWIGLLLIHGDWKGKQIGKKIVTALCDAAVLNETPPVNALQLGVIENNLAGLAFWSKMGFVKFRESQVKVSNGKTANAIVMEKKISAHFR